MMIKCREVSHLVASGAAADFGFMKRWQLKMHLALCRHCAEYARRMRALGDGMQKLVRSDEPSNHDLENLESRICERLGR